MRPLSLGALALLLVAVALVYFVFFSLNEAHVAALVPEDMAWGVFYRSVDDLREAYEHPDARRDVDPARLRLGRRVNVPGLDGVAQHRPFGSFMTRDFEEVFLVPFTDFDAFEEAFEKSQVDVNLRAPNRVARNYLAVSRAPVIPSKRADNRLVLRGLEHPISLVGRPRDAQTVKLMLRQLLEFEPPRRTAGGVPTLAEVTARLPTAAAELIAAECDDLVLGIEPGAEARAPVRAPFEARLAPGGLLARAEAVAAQAGLADAVASFPRETVLLAGAALDAAAWKELGFAAGTGDGAVACGIVDTQYRARRYTVLVVARNGASGEALAATLFGGGLTYKAVADKQTTVRTAVLPAIPDALADVLRASVRDEEPPVYVSHATEDGLAFCAVGSQAEASVRHALACRRGAEELSLGRAPLLGDHRALVTGTPALVAVVSPAGLRALRLPMPLFQIVSLAQPASVTMAARVEEARLVGEFRVQRETKTHGAGPALPEGVYKPK
jgi:hypothetical protein